MITARVLEPELMDDPSLDDAEHARALAGLARLNRLSFAARAHVPALRQAAARTGGVVRVLDVACGGGEGAAGLARHAANAGIRVEMTLLDRSPVAVERAVKCVRGTGVRGVRAVAADAVEDALPESDLVVCSLFLHHLDEHAAARCLSNMRSACRGVVSVNDLRRSRWGVLLARAVPPLVTTSRVVRTDAVISARAALTEPELRDLAARAGMDGARVERSFPARMTLTWSAGR